MENTPESTSQENGKDSLHAKYAGYLRTIEEVRANPALLRALSVANKCLTYIGYLAYPALLILLAFLDRGLLLRCIAVPAASFVAVSIFRYLFNAPRPYQLLGFKPLISKETQGKSFPSRHTFCMFMIAATWLVFNIWIGCALMLAGCAMAIIRVICGVHFPRDVVAGAVSALVLAAVGYMLIPWGTWPF